MKGMVFNKYKKYFSNSPKIKFRIVSYLSNTIHRYKACSDSV